MDIRNLELCIINYTLRTSSVASRYFYRHTHELVQQCQMFHVLIITKEVALSVIGERLLYPSMIPSAWAAID